MRVQIHDHQDKSDGLAQALRARGVDIVAQGGDILLIDWDGDHPHYNKPIEQAYQRGAEIIVYSHGAPVITAYDGIIEPSEYTAAYLAQSPGQKAVMQSYGYPLPIEVIGWHYCEQEPFMGGEIKRVLFAPWHPQGTKYLHPDAKSLNREIYTALAELPYQLTVRHVMNVETNGFTHLRGVEYQRAELSVHSAVKAIDAADIIVSNPGTFASLAVARGKPVVMFGQDICPHDGYSDTGLRYVESWPTYRDAMRYPYDITHLGAYGANYIMRRAAADEARDWRAAFIGDPLDGEKLLAVLEDVL